MEMQPLLLGSHRFKWAVIQEESPRNAPFQLGKTFVLTPDSLEHFILR